MSEVVNKDWEQMERISLGSLTDNVYKARRADNTLCIVKYFNLPVQLGQADETGSATGNRDSLIQLYDNIASLVHLNHENLVRVLDVKMVPQDVSVAMFLELVSGNSLEQLIQSRKATGGMLEEEIRVYVTQICRALVYLHSDENRIVHRVLDSPNVIVLEEGRLVKLLNFGTSLHLMHGASKQVSNCSRGKPHYWAPELFQQDSDESVYSFESDIWALGCLIYEMAAGEKPYVACRAYQAIATKVMKNGAPDLPNSCSFALRSFYYACTSRVRHDRPTAARLLENAFLLQGST